jgi:hypothetical protein
MKTFNITVGAVTPNPQVDKPKWCCKYDLELCLHNEIYLRAPTMSKDSRRDIAGEVKTFTFEWFVGC